MRKDMDTGNRPEWPTKPGQPRKALRVAVNAEVLLRRASGNRYRVRVFDLSPQGCKVEFVERPTLDERIWIKIDGLDSLEGMVCWIDGFVVGIDFLRPMHTAVFDHVVKRLG
ncbi:MAG: PilZ domain-containing protein [Sphingomicrobium sp.]